MQARSKEPRLATTGGDRILECCLPLGHDHVPGEVLHRVVPAPAPELLTRAVEVLSEGRCQRILVGAGADESRVEGAQELRRCADRSSDDREAARERLGGGHPEALVGDGGQDEEVGRPVPLDQVWVGDAPEEANALRDAELGGEHTKSLVQRPGARDGEDCVPFEPSQGPKQGLEPHPRREPPGGEEKGAVRVGSDPEPRGLSVIARTEDLHVHSSPDPHDATELLRPVCGDQRPGELAQDEEAVGTARGAALEHGHRRFEGGCPGLPDRPDLGAVESKLPQRGRMDDQCERQLRSGRDHPARVRALVCQGDVELAWERTDAVPCRDGIRERDGKHAPRQNAMEGERLTFLQAAARPQPWERRRRPRGRDRQASLRSPSRLGPTRRGSRGTTDLS